jgi:hypothetical protein
MVRPLQKGLNMQSFSMVAAAFAVLVPALASAQPAETDVQEVHAVSAAAEPTAPTSYVQLDGIVGLKLFDSEYEGFAVEGGHQLVGALWAHGMVGGGSMTIDNRQVGGFWMARAGLEARGSLPGTKGILGAFVGADVGARSFSGAMSSDMHAIALGRAGIDIGSSRLRLRTALGVDSDSMVEATAGIAYRW